MKTFKICLSMALVLSVRPCAHATTPNVLTKCSIHLPAMEENHPPMAFEIQIVDTDGHLSSKITQAGVTRDDNASKGDFPVRDSLNGDPDRVSPDLNEGETLIVHAMMMTSLPEMKGVMSVGTFDLEDVRSVTTYRFGIDENAMTPIGSTTLVEAKDAEGKLLGTFLGGFMVTPCE